MNRKNLTAAVLAGLAGVAGIAGTAQAVNMNPDGLGQVLIYPYYTANMGNQTLLSVVNTTNQAKAVKVRFLEGFNSREVLDFNLYLSAEDVWVAAIAAGESAPTLYVNDTSCTVPYLYANGGSQPFLDIRYTDNGIINGVDYDYSDAGPKGMTRAAEGHFEIIEMGTIDNDSDVGMAVTHAEASAGGKRMPANCDLLTQMWTRSDDPTMSGQWIKDAASNQKGNTGEGVGTTDIGRNSGGLFGGASIVNAANGTMFSYDAIALQGFDKYEDGLGLNFEPGTIYPSLNSGDQTDAWVFFGPPTNEAFNPDYNRDFDGTDFSVDAVSAVFMHSNIVNEYVISDSLNAATEWIITFPTKNFYADWPRMCEELVTDPILSEVCEEAYDGDLNPGPRQPFTKLFGQTMIVDDGAGGSTTEPNCEVVSLKTWDREEDTYQEPVDPTNPPGSQGPSVSPSLPPCIPAPGNPDCPVFPVGEVPFQLCTEVNILRFGEEEIFGTPTVAIDPEAGEVIDSLLLKAENEFDTGWGRIRFDTNDMRVDYAGLVGLPVTGFAAYEFENNFVGGENVKANYGGLFRHKGLVSREAATIDPR